MARKVSMSTTIRAAPAVDNAQALHRSKVEIRRNVLKSIGPDDARVFDAYAGEGQMFTDVWKGAADYLGCDLRFFPVGPPAYVADNRRVMRTIDLQRFNVFDLDAYGSPWIPALIIGARRKVRPGERIGVVLTEGTTMNLKLGGLDGGLRATAGISGSPAGMARQSALLLDAAIKGLGRRLQARVLSRWQAQGKTGAQMRYVGLIFEGAKPNDDSRFRDGSGRQ
jgi:hypothetical protein